MLRQYFKTFKKELLEWSETEHFVIGGVFALRLHGLNVRDTNDLDIICYKPTQAFVDFLVKENTTDNGSQPATELDGEKWRSWKISRGGMTIDFILEYDEEPSVKLLTYKWKGIDWPVQDISTIIEAKKSYNRPKDLADLKNFKRDNF